MTKTTTTKTPKVAKPVETPAAAEAAATVQARVDMNDPTLSGSEAVAAALKAQA